MWAFFALYQEYVDMNNAKDKAYKKIEQNLFKPQSEAAKDLTPFQLERRNRWIYCISQKMENPMISDRLLLENLMQGIEGMFKAVPISIAYQDLGTVKKGDLNHLNKHANLEVFIFANKEENYQVTGDISIFNRFSAKMTVIGIHNSSISVSITNLTSQFPLLQYLMFGDRKYYSESEYGYLNNTLISGDPHIFAPRATNVDFYSVYFNMPLLIISAINLTKNIVYVRCGTPTAPLDLVNLSNAQRVFRFDKPASYTGGTTKRFTQLDSLIHVGGGISSPQIDDLLIAISSSTFLPTGSGVKLYEAHEPVRQIVPFWLLLKQVKQLPYHQQQPLKIKAQ